MKLNIFICCCFGLGLLSNCAQMTTGLERELTMRAETEREFAAWWKDIRENPDQFEQEDRDFAERVFRIHRQTQSFPWEYVRRYFNDENLPAAPAVAADPTQKTTTPRTKVFTQDGDYWRWNDNNKIWYFKEDAAGKFELSRDTVVFYLEYLDQKEKTLKAFGLKNNDK